MTTIPMHVVWQEYGADIEDVDTEYDEVTHITVTAGIRLDFPLDNHTQVFLLIHHPGDPSPELHPDAIVIPQYKGESVAIRKEGTGLRVDVSGHQTGADPNPHAPGSRLTTIESATVPNVFVSR